MALDFNDLIRAFEPILYFADGERFFPSDCKRYLERASLWSAVTPFDNKDSWHTSAPGALSQPIIPPKQVSGRSGEPGTFLGESQSGSFPFLFASGPEEGFLDLTGWADSPNITTLSENRFANLTALDAVYNSSTSPVDALLKGSRFWYHAEVFDLPRLRALMSGQHARPDFRELLPVLLEPSIAGDPLLLCYYLFFPGHDEPLDDCGTVAESALFGSYAGEWACISILVKTRTTGIPIGGGGPTTEECTPVAIGLTSRNVGDVGFLGGERRVGMTVHDWDATVDMVTRDRGPSKLPGVHPRIFVARGTHGLYLSESFLGVPMPFFAPDDSSRQHCGASELLGKSLEDLTDEADEAADDTWVDDSEVVWTKMLINLVWAAVEWIAGGGGGLDAVGTKTPEQFDHPPMRDAPEYFSVIIHPSGVAPPKGDKAQTFAWQFPLSNEAALETTLKGRVYSMRVDRTNQNAVLRQIWWPGIQGFTGYSGRWGPRVTNDPKARRAGMKFPEFWEMFMTAFAKSKAM